MALARAVAHGPESFYGYGLTAITGVGAGSVYPFLADLTDLGWVTRLPLDPPRGGRPPRRRYVVTEAGRGQLLAWLARR